MAVLCSKAISHPLPTSTSARDCLFFVDELLMAPNPPRACPAHHEMATPDLAGGALAFFSLIPALTRASAELLQGAEATHPGRPPRRAPPSTELSRGHHPEATRTPGRLGAAQ